MSHNDPRQMATSPIATAAAPCILLPIEVRVDGCTIWNGLTSVWYNHLQGINIWILYIHGYPSLRGGGPAESTIQQTCSTFSGRGLNSIFENICVFFSILSNSIQPKLLLTPLNGLIGGNIWTFFDPWSLILKWPKNQWVSTGCFFVSHPYYFCEVI